jgi:hypothetical protein
MPRCSSLVLIFAVIAVSLTPISGRTSLKQFGKIKGRVVDVNNARIPRADITIVGEGLRWRVTTDSEGEFEISLPIGEYRLSVEANGFRRSASQKFLIKSGKTQRFNIEMQIASPQLLVPASSGPEFDFITLACCAGFAGKDARAPSHV